MNANPVLTSNYENKPPRRRPKNKPNQTQFEPKQTQSPRRTLSGKNVFLRILVAKRCFLGYNPGCLEVLRTDKGEEKAIFMEQDGVFAHHIQD